MAYVAISIDRACEGVIDGVQRFLLMRIAAGRCRHSATGTIAPACLPLLGKLPVDFLPVKDNIGMPAGEVALVLGGNRIVADAPEVEILPADFDGEIAKALAGRDEGAALLTCHVLLRGLFQKAIMHMGSAQCKPNENRARPRRAYCMIYAHNRGRMASAYSFFSLPVFAALL